MAFVWDVCIVAWVLFILYDRDLVYALIEFILQMRRCRYNLSIGRKNVRKRL